MLEIYSDEAFNSGASELTYLFLKCKFLFWMELSNTFLLFLALLL